MKKTYSLFLSVLFLAALSKTTSAQSLVEINGTCPLSLNSSVIITGGGAGFGFYTPPLDLIRAKYKNQPSPLCMRFGGNFYYNGAGHKTFSSVPLLSGAGNASVDFSNSLTAINFSVKISSSLFDGKLIPYAEGFTGLRYFSSDMTITPNDKDEKSNSITISKTSGLNVGASGGMMIRITDDFFIDTGVMFSHSEVQGEFVDTHALKRVGSSIGYKTEKLPSDFLVFKLGVTGCIADNEWRGDGSGWDNFFEHLFDNIGSGGGGSGTIGLFKL